MGIHVILSRTIVIFLITSVVVAWFLVSYVPKFYLNIALTASLIPSFYAEVFANLKKSIENFPTNGLPERAREVLKHRLNEYWKKEIASWKIIGMISTLISTAVGIEGIANSKDAWLSFNWGLLFVTIFVFQCLSIIHLQSKTKYVEKKKEAMLELEEKNERKKKNDKARGISPRL